MTAELAKVVWRYSKGGNHITFDKNKTKKKKRAVFWESQSDGFDHYIFCIVSKWRKNIQTVIRHERQVNYC